MHRDEFKELSRLRQSEARVLLRENLFAGAYYLIGFSVECALKACVAKATRPGTVRDKGFEAEFYKHNLERLLILSGNDVNELKKDQRLHNNWLVVKHWDVNRRYDVEITRDEASDLYSACTSYKYGLLPWIRKRW